MENVSLYTTLPNYVIGFHGCDQETYEKVINQNVNLKFSNNDYDWLGNGIYFWEQDLERAWEWAKQAATRTRGEIKKPAVIGAVIDLGLCLNLLDDGCIDLLRQQYEMFKLSFELADKEVPKNIGKGKDLPLRKLDCAVIENLHNNRKKNNEPAFDSVRGVFFEGDSIYPTSGFYQHSHIQICVRNPNCIKGYFSPRMIDKKWRVP